MMKKMGWMPQTKAVLIDRIYILVDKKYTKKKIESIYNNTYNSIPQRWKYYARQAARRKLQWWLSNVVQKKKNIN